MDLLKNLQSLALDDKKETAHNAPHVAAAPAPAPAPAHESIFNKIGDALSGSHPAPAPAPVAVATPVHEQSSADKLLAKIGESFVGKAAAAPAPVAAPAPAPKKDENLLHKIGDALGGAYHAPAVAPAPAPVPEKSGADKLLSKIGESLSGKYATPVPPPAPKKDESIFDKIGGVVSGHKPAPPAAPVKEENLFDKLSTVISGKHEAPIATHETISDKINSALGGGRKGEAEEGKLDKGE